MLKEALVKEDEQPYAVPGNWVWTNLGSILSLEYGKGMPKRQRSGDGYPVYGSNGIVGFHKDALIGGPAIIIGRKGSIGEVNWSNDKCWPIDTTYYVKTYTDLDFAFVYRLLTAINLKELNRATAIPGLNRDDAYKLKIGFPPLLEQKRIIKKLSSMLGKLKEARELIREAKETFEERRAAVLNKAFTGELTRKWREENPDVESADKLVEMFIDIKKSQEKNGKKGDISTYKEIIIKEDEQPFGLPASWVFVRLGKVLQINPPKYKPEIDNDITCSFVPMKAVSDKLGIIENIETKPFGKVKNGYTSFKDNDVLFAKITPCMENGKAAIAKNLINGFGYGSTEFFVFRCSTIVDNNFLYFLVRSKFFRDLAKPNMTGTVGHRRVPKVYLHNYKFPLPPITEQKEIVRILHKLLEHENEAKALIDLEEQFDLLNKSILSKAFRGELGTNDPNDEPAIEILKRSLIEKMSVSQSR